MYAVTPKKPGKESSPSVKSDSSIDSSLSTQSEFSENLPDIAREASTTLYAKAGDKKVTL